MTSHSLGEHLLLREDHSRTTNSTDSAEASTTSSTSITPGPGALTARFLKWVGNTGLDSLQELVVRRRLVVIKQLVRNKPHVFTNSLSSQDVYEVNRIYYELRELCSGDYYPLRLQRKAARMILEIAFLHSGRVNESEINREDRSILGRDRWNRWSALLRISTTSFDDGSWVSKDGDLIESMDVGLSSMATTMTAYTTDTVKSLASNRTWTSVRRARQTAIGTVGIRAKLSFIQRAVRKRPYIFTSAQGSQQMQEADNVFNDLARLAHPRHSLRTRQKAARLVLEIAVMISGPSGVIRSQTSLEDDEVTTVSTSMWDELMTRSDVQSLLTLGLQPDSTLARHR